MVGKAIQVKAWLLFAMSQSVLSRLSQNLMREISSYFQDSFFASLYGNTAQLYDWTTQQCTQYTLSVNFGNGGSFIQVDTHTLLCLGARPASKKVYTLDLSSLTLTSLSPLRTARESAGVAKAAHTVFIFGGCDPSYSKLKSCEKYGLKSRRWLPLSDMREKRNCFTPCTFRTLIYLPCPNTTPILETFSPQTNTFTVLPVSLNMVPNASVSFVANGELCVLTNGKQMGRWRIESEGKFRLFDMDISCCSSQPPLIVNSLVLINNTWNDGRVEKFSLESYTFI